MKQMICSICSYVYDETEVSSNVKWQELPYDWKCPICQAGKEAFVEKNEQATEKKLEKPTFDRELSAMEMSIICSNLALGCQKQYLFRQAEGFAQLAEFFKSKVEPIKSVSSDRLLELVQKDLEVNYPYAKALATKKADRGALRALTWSEKATTMLHSLLLRYKNEGEKMLEKTNVYLCSVCGFIYLGETAPKLCPVCKVADWKFEKIEGRN